MPFPEAKRVIYKQNTLDNVICQLRFPPNLTIDLEVPAGFQEAIREDYPIYEETTEFQQEISLQLKGEILNPMSKVSTNKNHLFTSEDGVWKINLTRTFISISCSKYTRWEEFIARFEKPLKTLQEIYSPPFFTRLGLRYINVFCRSKLGLNEVDWSELIQPQFLGFLASDIKSHVSEFSNACEVKLSDDISSARIITTMVNNKQGERCFMVDSDFYTPSKVDTQEVFKKLDFIHKRSTNSIRTIITPILHQTMRPTEI
jgi:uncharacterized protein (TIGR04255 family)